MACSFISTPHRSSSMVKVTGSRQKTRAQQLLRQLIMAEKETKL